MLAYELFLNNKDSTSNNADNIPIKKIFFDGKNIIIDSTTLEEFGSDVKKNSTILQRSLSMPLKTIDVNKLNLPDNTTSSSSPQPYVKISGSITFGNITKKNPDLNPKMNLSLKSDKIKHILDLTTGEITENHSKEITLNLDKNKYFINSKSLFSEYVDSKIIDKNKKLNFKLYDKIIRTFLKFVKNKNLEFKKQTTSRFEIFILPNNLKIEFIEKTKKCDQIELFTDYFGNLGSNYPSKVTKNTKFLSYDDKAFTLNCKKNKNFYKNLGISDSSFKKIFVDSTQTFVISRLEWTFTDISNPDFKFIETKQGIFTQLHSNYTSLKKDKGKTAQAQLKISCVKLTNFRQQQEVLVDENLTMKKMDKLFSHIPKEIPYSCFENALIDDTTQAKSWNTYVYVVKSFLAGHKIQKTFLLNFFSRILKQQRFEWIKLKDTKKQSEFFINTDFIFKALCTSDFLESYMDSNEEFAQKIGQIARVYMDFKQNNGEHDNSLSDMLSYSKYDKDKLSFVYSRICRGVELSKISKNIKKVVSENISKLTPSDEIETDSAQKDYSYFFYKGYYSKLEVKA
jgi:hypothetical protein